MRFLIVALANIDRNTNRELLSVGKGTRNVLMQCTFGISDPAAESKGEFLGV